MIFQKLQNSNFRNEADSYSLVVGFFSLAVIKRSISSVHMARFTKARCSSLSFHVRVDRSLFTTREYLTIFCIISVGIMVVYPLRAVCLLLVPWLYS